MAVRSRTGRAVPSKPSTDPTVRAVCGSEWELYLVLAVGSETRRLAKAVEGEASSATQKLRWAAVVAWDVPARQPAARQARRTAVWAPRTPQGRRLKSPTVIRVSMLEMFSKGQLQRRISSVTFT